jgi:hypothetical protein
MQLIYQMRDGRFHRPPLGFVNPLLYRLADSNVTRAALASFPPG